MNIRLQRNECKLSCASLVGWILDTVYYISISPML